MGQATLDIDCTQHDQAAHGVAVIMKNDAERDGEQYPQSSFDPKMTRQESFNSLDYSSIGNIVAPCPCMGCNQGSLGTAPDTMSQWQYGITPTSSGPPDATHWGAQAPIASAFPSYTTNGPEARYFSLSKQLPLEFESRTATESQYSSSPDRAQWQYGALSQPASASDLSTMLPSIRYSTHSDGSQNNSECSEVSSCNPIGCPVKDSARGRSDDDHMPRLYSSGSATPLRHGQQVPVSTQLMDWSQTHPGGVDTACHQKDRSDRHTVRSDDASSSESKVRSNESLSVSAIWRVHNKRVLSGGNTSQTTPRKFQEERSDKP